MVISPNVSGVCMRIYRVAGCDITDPRDCSVYLLDGRELALIDAGFGESIGALAANIKTQGLDPKKVSTLILTHCHVDHIGGAREFRTRYGSRLVMHELDAEIVGRADQRLTAAFCFKKVFRPFLLDIVLSGEQGLLAIGEKEVVWLHTPGHTPGSISVYVDVGGKRVLFAQDFAASLLEEFDCDPEAWRRSAMKLLALNADVLCDGHAGIHQPAEAVERYIKARIAANLGLAGIGSSGLGSP